MLEYVYTYRIVLTHVHIYIYIYMYVLLHMRMFISLYMRMFISLSLFVGINVHIRTVLLHIYHMYTCMYKCHSASSKYIHYCICQILQKNQLNMYIFKYVYNKSIYIYVSSLAYIHIYIHVKIWKRYVCVYVHTMYLYISIPL